MRLSHLTRRLAAAAVIAGGAVGLLGGPGSAGATVPATNGTIVVSKCEDGPDSCNVIHLWTMDPASGAEHQLTSGASYDYDPAVSPDGQLVAFERCPTGGLCRIAVVGIAGGAVTNLTPGTSEEDYPAFSPDGSKLVFDRKGPGGSQLIVMNAGGGSEQPLTSGTVSDWEPAWSPDGSTVAFERYDALSGARIYKVAASGGVPVALSAGPRDYAPSFSPDGSRIAFQGSDTVDIMDDNGADRHPLTAPPTDFHDADPAFSPDGTQIVFEREARHAPVTSPLLVMNADGSNLHTISGSTERLYRAGWQPLHPAADSGSTPTAGSSADPTPTADTTPQPDTTAPGLALAAPRKESVRKGRVYLFATSSEAGTAVASGRISVSKLAKTYRLRPASKTLSANARTKVTLKLSRESLRALRAAFAHRQRVKATLVVRIKNSAGNVTNKQLRMRLIK
jgi:Tol biopolymer transport system component